MRIKNKATRKIQTVRFVFELNPTESAIMSTNTYNRWGRQTG